MDQVQKFETKGYLDGWIKFKKIETKGYLDDGSSLKIWTRWLSISVSK
jgi:hypothetical protein